MVLGHDVTRIVPGKFKGRAFKRGHIIREEDLPLLLDIGKEHIYVLDLDDGFVHEDEAANRIAQAAVGPGLKLTDVSEGKVNIVAAHAGLLKVNPEALAAVNALGEVVFATLHANQPVKADQAVAGTRIIPLVIEREKIEAAEALCRAANPVVEVKPLASRNVGLITTGSEVYHGRIEDKFGPVVIRKFEDLGSRILRQIFVPDDVDMTVSAIHTLLDEGAEMIVMTGGMSVDPDDLTPASIRAAGARVVGYGAPVFPGAMFMLAHIDDVPIVGLPGCVMYHKATIFELVVPRILAGEIVAYEEITRLGYGGFCAGCKECRYPLCGFGKG
jgi:molybdenum cofactor synthesis domain-containing protein